MQEKPNIILISADSLRANHLGCYQYPLPTSPNIDRLACQGVLCENMFAPGIPTQPSHTTIFTGQHPVTHGVVAHGGKAKLGRGTPYLPEILLEEGYTTCAVDTLFRERIWFGRGYEYIIDPSLHHVFYASVTQDLGRSHYARIDAPATPAEKTILAKLDPAGITTKELAGEPIEAKLTRAPGNNEPIGGIKVVAKNGWFAARPSGTEDVYKIYAESFLSAEYLKQIQDEAQALVAEQFARE